MDMDIRKLEFPKYGYFSIYLLGAAVFSLWFDANSSDILLYLIFGNRIYSAVMMPCYEF